MARRRSKARTKKTKEFTGLKDNIEKVSIKMPKHHPKNPRLHDERNLQAIVRSIDEFKQLAPLVLWGTRNYVIVGNGRLEAAKRLGWKEIEIIRADHLSEDQAMAYMIADNKTTDLSEFDFQIVAQIMGKLADRKVDLEMTGFADYEVEPLLQAEWKPPTAGDMPTHSDARTVKFSEDQWPSIEKALNLFREFEGHEKEEAPEALAIICQEWMRAVE